MNVTHMTSFIQYSMLWWWSLFLLEKIQNRKFKIQILNSIWKCDFLLPFLSCVEFCVVVFHGFFVFHSFSLFLNFAHENKRPTTELVNIVWLLSLVTLFNLFCVFLFSPHKLHFYPFLFLFFPSSYKSHTNNSMKCNGC